MAIGTILMWIYYGIQFYVVNKLTHNVGWAGLAVFVSFLTGKFVLYYYPFLLKTLGLFRALTNQQKMKDLKAERNEICDLVAQINKN
ncbi:MAG: hypothetical protein IPJ32_00375 [Sphingobacteriaceae bacterium]|nr:hypothetical protein [Sphingobacteriaceae bacterium]